MRQIPLALGAPSVRSFDNFFGAASAAAVGHLQSFAAAAPPVYLWGPSGSGKTHLLQALVGRFDAEGSRAGSFGPESPSPWRFDERWGLVVLDACDDLDPLQQHAAFRLFIEATEAGTPIAAAGCVPPVDLPLREDLRTRLGWGHVYALQPLGEAETRAALRREADARGILLSDDVMDHLLTRFARDLKHLLVLLDRLDRFSIVTQRFVSVPLLKQMLAEDAA